MDQIRYNKALHLAAIKHNGQTITSRKNVPFIVHPIFVSKLVAEFGFDDDTIIAGLLHDIVEDTDVTIEEIQNIFGDNIADLVKGVTNDQSLSWEERQPITWEKMRSARSEVKAIKAADVINHFVLKKEDLDRGIKIEDILGFTAKQTVWKYENLLSALRQKWSHPILDEAQYWFDIVKKEHLTK